MEHIMDVKLIREHSLKIVDSLGESISKSLPLLEGNIQLRSSKTILERILCLHAIAACSYGFERILIIEWLAQEKLDTKLTPNESLFLHGGIGSPPKFKQQIECMWALAWSLNLVAHLDFKINCSDDFVRLMPDLKHSENSQMLQNKMKIRPLKEIVASCDLAYCLHWLIRDRELAGNKKTLIEIQPRVIIERRRALEWLLNNESWDNVSLDT